MKSKKFDLHPKEYLSLSLSALSPCPSSSPSPSSLKDTLTHRTHSQQMSTHTQHTLNPRRPVPYPRTCALRSVGVNLDAPWPAHGHDLRDRLHRPHLIVRMHHAHQHSRRGQRLTRRKEGEKEGRRKGGKEKRRKGVKKGRRREGENQTGRDGAIS